MSNALKKAKRRYAQKELAVRQADPSSVLYSPQQGDRTLTLSDISKFRRLLKGKHREVVSKLMEEPLEGVSALVDALDNERVGKLWSMVQQTVKEFAGIVATMPVREPGPPNPAEPSKSTVVLSESGQALQEQPVPDVPQP